MPALRVGAPGVWGRTASWCVCELVRLASAGAPTWAPPAFLVGYAPSGFNPGRPIAGPDLSPGQSSGRWRNIREIAVAPTTSASGSPPRRYRPPPARPGLRTSCGRRAPSSATALLDASARHREPPELAHTHADSRAAGAPAAVGRQGVGRLAGLPLRRLSGRSPLTVQGHSNRPHRPLPDVAPGWLGLAARRPRKRLPSRRAQRRRGRSIGRADTLHGSGGSGAQRRRREHDLGPGRGRIFRLWRWYSISLSGLLLRGAGGPALPRRERGDPAHRRRQALCALDLADDRQAAGFHFTPPFFMSSSSLPPEVTTPSLPRTGSRRRRARDSPSGRVPRAPATTGTTVTDGSAPLRRACLWACPPQRRRSCPGGPDWHRPRGAGVPPSHLPAPRCSPRRPARSSALELTRFRAWTKAPSVCELHQCRRPRAGRPQNNQPTPLRTVGPPRCSGIREGARSDVPPPAPRTPKPDPNLSA